MELRHLRYFVAVAEELHFGRAARRLNISQPPLSQQIRALEKEVQADLFTRDTRRVELTAPGGEFLKYARAALDQAAQGVLSARRVQRGEVGRLGVGFITSMAYTYLPWLVRVFRNRYPDVELVLTEQETWNQILALQERRLDVGIVRGPVEASGVSNTAALTEPFVVALPDDHRLARHRTVRLSALADDSFIMFPRSIGGRFYEAVGSLFQRAGFTPRIAQEAIQMHVTVGLVSARLGVALVPRSIQLLQTPGVVYRPLASNSGKAAIVIAHRDDDRSSVVRAFKDVAVEIISRGTREIERQRALPADGARKRRSG
jgi:DNA-binding transcriptional LysR family regulator